VRAPDALARLAGRWRDRRARWPARRRRAAARPGDRRHPRRQRAARGRPPPRRPDRGRARRRARCRPPPRRGRPARRTRPRRPPPPTPPGCPPPPPPPPPPHLPGAAMPALTSEQRALQLRARELAQRQFAPTAADTDRTEQYPWANVALLRDAGFMGMTLPTRV